VRTLAEAFARELAVCYQQLRKVYQHGFLDTAEGVALDHVVALLGMNRQRAGHLEGLVTFRRPQPAARRHPGALRNAWSAAAARRSAQRSRTRVLARSGQEVSVRVRSLEPGGQAVKARRAESDAEADLGRGHRRQPRRPAAAAKRGNRRRAARAGAPSAAGNGASARRRRSHRRCARSASPRSRCAKTRAEPGNHRSRPR
jgi:hypothetical protein